MLLCSLLLGFRHVPALSLVTFPSLPFRRRLSGILHLFVIGFLVWSARNVLSAIILPMLVSTSDPFTQGVAGARADHFVQKCRCDGVCGRC